MSRVRPAFDLGLTVWLMAACAGSRPMERSAYDLRSGDFLLAVNVPVRMDVRMVPWMDTIDMNYRLSYDTPTRLRVFAESRWVARAGLLLGERLQTRFGGGGAVVPKCQVQVDIGEYSQHFETATRSRFVIEARWRVSSLNAGKGELLLSEGRQFAVESTSADARGGAMAAQGATDQLGAAILSSVQSLAGCR